MKGVGRSTAAVLVATLAVVSLSACDTRASWEREALGRTFFDSTGTYVHAGVSARTNVEVDPLDPATLGSDSASRSYHLYGMRCGSCHEAPDPKMKAGEHWSSLVGRMRDKTRTAGVIPMTDAEADSILTFLRRHARSPDEGGRRKRP